MPTPFESAQINLRLFELRRDEVLREARMWFMMQFNPETFAEFVALAGGERNASFRMVLGYWDMAASMVTFDAVDAEMFLAAHTEIIATFAKVQPFIEELRQVSGSPTFCRHLEAVVMAMPGADETLALRRAQFREAAKRREASAAHATLDLDQGA